MTEDMLDELMPDTELHAISESPNGRWLLACDDGGLLHLVDLAYPDEPPWPITIDALPGPWAADSSGFHVVGGFFSLTAGLSDPRRTIRTCT